MSFVPGSGQALEGASPAGELVVVFEDDKDTGYFYALEMSRGESPIVDALHIYDVAQVTDRDKSSEAVIAWSRDGKKAVLLINDYPHAVFDFANKRGYCRSGFPPPDKRWTSSSHDWSDDALALFG